MSWISQYEDIRDPDTDEALGSDRASEGQSKNYSRTRKIVFGNDIPKRASEYWWYWGWGFNISWSVRSISYAPQLGSRGMKH